jgi:hypothetical protein
MRAYLDIREHGADPIVDCIIDDPEVSNPQEMWEKLGIELGYITKIETRELRPMKRKTTVIEEYE